MRGFGALQALALSSTHNTSACVVAQDTNSMISVTLVTSSGSVENLNVAARHGWTPNALHAANTVA
jgi:hypothetical protein